MTRHPFAPAAQLLWDEIPPAGQQRILGSVWCGHCSTGRRIEDFTGVPDGGGIRLQGFCAVCGHVVVRLIEHSNAPLASVTPIRKAAAPASKPKATRAKPDALRRLSLTCEQVTLIIEHTMIDDTMLAMLHRSKVTDEMAAVRGTLDDFDELAGYVAAEANHTKDKKLRKQLDAISGSIEVLLRKPA